jgi:hypothetical protein
MACASQSACQGYAAEKMSDFADLGGQSCAYSERRSAKFVRCTIHRLDESKMGAACVMRGLDPRIHVFMS